jgi:hypothetical protein
MPPDERSLTLVGVHDGRYQRGTAASEAVPAGACNTACATLPDRHRGGANQPHSEKRCRTVLPVRSQDRRPVALTSTPESTSWRQCRDRLHAHRLNEIRQTHGRVRPGVA